ncbi:SSPO protein, partial [Anthoscopus minutus]|nr:SSPO protein [Anthoscopus minutus]
QERGRWRVPGERWRGGPCQVCQCLPGGAVRCVPYCPLRHSGCPQGQVLREGDGGSCCTCGPAGDNATATPPGMMTALSPSAPAKGSPGYERGQVEHRDLGVPKAGGRWGPSPVTPLPPAVPSRPEGPPRPPPSGWPRTPPEPPGAAGGTHRTATPAEDTPRA